MTSSWWREGGKEGRRERGKESRNETEKDKWRQRSDC